MKNILIFAGTTEGRKLAEYLQDKPYSVYISTATEYGKECIGCYENETLLSGRMDEDEMAALIQEKSIDLVIDATHPFAQDVTKNICTACEKSQVEYIRCLREASHQELWKDYEQMVVVNSIEEAVLYCQRQDGNIFITTGSKELVKYKKIDNYKERCYARVLSTETAVTESIKLGFEGKHLIAMQGPFTKELNVAMMKAVSAKLMITKESGSYGGFTEKVEAAKEVGAVLVVIARPLEKGESLEEIKTKLKT